MWHRYDGLVFDLTGKDHDVQICDPEYDIGDLGTLDITMSPGSYGCFYNITNDEYVGQKIAASMMLRKDLEIPWSTGGCLKNLGFSAHDLGEIYVNSGLAGFIAGDRASMDWADNMKVFTRGLASTGNIITHNRDDDFFDQAFFTSAGFGEEYSEHRVQVIEYNGKPAGLVIVFIE